MGDEYGIYYRPEVAAARVAGARRGLIARCISTLVSVAIFGVLWAIWPATFASWAPWFIGASLVSGGAFAVVNLVQYLRAVADARDAVPGLAIGLNRDGVLIGERWLTWPEVGSMLVRPAALGASARLVTTGRDQSASTVPLDLTDAMPASLDSVVRVLSGGRASVDLSLLDQLRSPPRPVRTTTDFTMGDGHSVDCAATGVYQDKAVKPATPSPTCGYTYSRRSPEGRPYPITAATHWPIDWSAGGEHGSFVHTWSGSRALVVGELHALIDG